MNDMDFAEDFHRAYCTECKQECTVKTISGSDGDGVWAMSYTAEVSDCCEAEISETPLDTSKQPSPKGYGFAANL